MCYPPTPTMRCLVRQIVTTTGMIGLLTFLIQSYFSPYLRWNESALSNSKSEADLLEQCSPAKKVAFMKNHKCASTTIANIMYRHAYRHGLNVVIPNKGGYLSTINLFNRNVTSDTPWAPLEMDVFTLHNRWNYQEVVALMGPSVRTFSIVRHPVDLFESLYSYFQLNVTYGVNLKRFVRILRDQKSSKIVRRGRAGFLGRNQLSWDLGIDPDIYDLPLDSDVIRERIDKLDKEFELVMITERMEESLVLLAHLFCWPLEWVTHLDLNARKQEMKAEAGQQLDEEDRRILAEFLALDVTIYNYFKRRFEERLAQFNAQDEKTMEKELRLLQEVNDKVKEDCVIQKIGNDKLKGKFHEFSNSVMGYVLNLTVPGCELYGWSQKTFLEYFREVMTKRAKIVS